MHELVSDDRVRLGRIVKRSGEMDCRPDGCCRPINGSERSSRCLTRRDHNRPADPNLVGQGSKGLWKTLGLDPLLLAKPLEKPNRKRCLSEAFFRRAIPHRAIPHSGGS